MVIKRRKELGTFKTTPKEISCQWNNLGRNWTVYFNDKTLGISCPVKQRPLQSRKNLSEANNDWEGQIMMSGDIKSTKVYFLNLAAELSSSKLSSPNPHITRMPLAAPAKWHHSITTDSYYFKQLKYYIV